MNGHLFSLGTGIILVTVIFHVFSLATLAALLRRIGARFAKLHQFSLTIILLAISVIGVLLIHVIEAWAWALVYIVLGEFTSLEQALYFSIVTSTTLGYGDITLSEQWQLLSTFEAMGGLILFGASTAFLLGFMRHMFEFDE